MNLKAVTYENANLQKPFWSWLACFDRDSPWALWPWGWWGCYNHIHLHCSSFPWLLCEALGKILTPETKDLFFQLSCPFPLRHLPGLPHVIMGSYQGTKFCSISVGIAEMFLFLRRPKRIISDILNAKFSTDTYRNSPKHVDFLWNVQNCWVDFLCNIQNCWVDSIPISSTKTFSNNPIVVWPLFYGRITCFKMFPTRTGIFLKCLKNVLKRFLFLTNGTTIPTESWSSWSLGHIHPSLSEYSRTICHATLQAEEQNQVIRTHFFFA